MERNPFAVERFRNLPESSLEETFKNPCIKLPFDGKDVGMFLDRKSGQTKLRVLDYHHRSADLGVNTIIQEKDAKRHHVYCQIDLKGSGFQFPESYESKKSNVPRGMMSGTPEAYILTGSQETPWGYEPMGLMDERSVDFTVKIADRLSAAGMRTEAVAAVYRLHSLVLDGKEVTTKSFKQQNIDRIVKMAKAETNKEERAHLITMARDVRDNFQPVLMVRLMRSVLRVRDLGEESEKIDQMIAEACQSLNNEARGLNQLGGYEAETKSGVDRWLLRVGMEYGKNLGILQREGLVHMFLHMGNVTLAGEVVDLDSISDVLKKKVFTGKPENKQKWLEKGDEDGPYLGRPSFRETENGCVFIDPAVGLHQTPDAEFGIPRCLLKDIRDICFSTRGMLKNLKEKYHPETRRKMSQEFIRGYMEGLGEGKAFEQIGLTKERLIEVCSKMSEELIERGGHYSPIPGDDE
ncbi:hypothetical protein IT408_00140 [Candidatus Uhrbacteria bacterium]|nr:hypothetical protein [Candidatus Uhrbacteria bacterium]